MNRKSILGIVIGIILAFALTFCTSHFLLKQVVLIQDKSFELTMPKSEINALRFKLLSMGYHLNTTTLEEEDFEENKFEEKLKTDRAKFVILSPVVSSFATKNNINISSMNAKIPVVALGTGSSELFDAVLISDQSNTEDAVDYRYSLSIKKGKVSCPALKISLSPIIGKTKEELNHMEGVLVYETRTK